MSRKNEKGGTPMKKRLRHAGIVFILILTFIGAAVLGGCEGSDARKQIDDTVKKASGAELVEKGEKMKQQIRDLTAEDIERIQKDIEKGVYGEKE